MLTIKDILPGRQLHAKCKVCRYFGGISSPKDFICTYYSEVRGHTFHSEFRICHGAGWWCENHSRWKPVGKLLTDKWDQKLYVDS
jgi:hypothetical protein